MPRLADLPELLPPTNDGIPSFHQFTGIYHAGHVGTMSALQIPWIVLFYVILVLNFTFLAGFVLLEWMLLAIPTGHGNGNLPPCADMHLDGHPSHAGLLHDVPHTF